MITVDGSRGFPESVVADRYLYTAGIADGTVYRGRPEAKTLDEGASTSRGSPAGAGHHPCSAAGA